MSEIKRYTVVECRNDEEFWAKMKEIKHGDYVLYSDYTELEKQLSELKESQKQKQIIKLCERLDKAEQQNKQMLEAINKTYAEFERIKNNPDVSLKDRIYLDGVLAILDVKLKQPIESVTGKPIEEATK